MSRTGGTVLVVAGIIIVVAAAFEIATRPAPPETAAPGDARLPGEVSAPLGDGVPTGKLGLEENAVPGMATDTEGLLTRTIDLYFLRPDGQGLSPVSTEIFDTVALLDRLKQTVSALIRGPGVDSPLDPVLPADTPLRDLYLDKEGTLYVDFGQELVNSLPSGSTAEVLAAGGLANTLVLNFAEVHRVRILVAGEELRTLGGHLDLTRPLTAEPQLVVPWVEHEE